MYVVLFMLANVMMTSSYPYSHLSRVRERRLPNPRQIYSNQNMLLRGGRGRKGVLPRAAEEVSRRRFPDSSLTPTSSQAGNPLLPRSSDPTVQQQSDAQPMHFPHSNQPQQPIADQRLAYLGNGPLLQQTNQHQKDLSSSSDSLPPRTSEDPSSSFISQRAQKGETSQEPSDTDAPVSSEDSQSLTNDVQQESSINREDSNSLLRPAIQPLYTENSQNIPHLSSSSDNQESSYHNVPSQLQPSPDQQPNYFNGPVLSSSSEQQPSYGSRMQPSTGQLTYLNNGALVQKSNDHQQAYVNNGPLTQSNGQQPPYLNSRAHLQPSNEMQTSFGRTRLRTSNNQPSSFLNTRPQLQATSNQQPSYLSNGGLIQQPSYNQQQNYFGSHQQLSYQQSPYYGNQPLLPHSQQPSYSNHPSNFHSEQQTQFMNSEPSSSINQPQRREFVDNHYPEQTNEDGPEEPQKPEEQPSIPEGQNQDESPVVEEGSKKCDIANCPKLKNCVNTTTIDCCPVCEVKGCQCEGYQYYDCVSNGFEGGLVPEGKSYSVDMGSTICSCPIGGGVIMCSFQDQFGGQGDFPQPDAPALICPVPPTHCIETYTRSDGCVECVSVGCVGEGGTKHQEGARFTKQPCSTCNCPPGGGELICLTDSSCYDKQVADEAEEPQQTSLALEATQRVMRDPLAAEKDEGKYHDDIEDGYDTRYLQADWNSFGSQDKMSPIEGETSLSTGPRDSIVRNENRDSNSAGLAAEPQAADPIVHPLVNPDNSNVEKNPGIFQQSGFNLFYQGYNHQYPYSYNYGYNGQTANNGRYDALLPNNYGAQIPVGQDQGQLSPDLGQQNLSPGSDSAGPSASETPDQSDAFKDPKSEAQSQEKNQKNDINGLQKPERNTNDYLSQPTINSGGQGRYSFLPRQQVNSAGISGQSLSNSKLNSPILPSGIGNEAQNLQNNYFGYMQFPLANPAQTDEGKHQAGGETNVPLSPVGEQQTPGFNGLFYPDGRQPVDGNQLLPNPNFYNGALSPYPQQNPGFLPYPQQMYPGYGMYNSEMITALQNGADSKLAANESSIIPGPEYRIHPTVVTKQVLNELNSVSIEANKTTSFENVLSACCIQGQQWAVAHRTCSGIPVDVNTYNQICAVAQEKCCSDSLEQDQCRAGISTARSMASCDVARPLNGGCLGNQFKTCCDCCALGLKAYSLSLSCEMEILGAQCNSAYTECCQKGRLTSAGVETPMTSSPSVPPSSASTSSNQPTEGGAIPRCATHNNCPQECVDVDDGIRCACMDGFELDEDGATCNDINECVLGTHTCVEGQFCLNLLGSFNCQRLISCGTGYELTDKNTCNDIDECALNLHNCGERLSCVNIRGSFRCIPKMCDDGFFTDASGGCIDIDECRAGDFSCPPRAHCENTIGSYLCRCPDGLTFDKSSDSCHDVNECTLNPTICREGSTCVNTDGSFTCINPPSLKCMAGYEANEEGTTCVDIDECARGTHTCASGSTCINDEGSFRCEDPIVCGSGTKPSPSGRSCVDINECEESGDDLCGEGGICVNIPGSYRCECRRGYEKENLSNGTEICQDVNECVRSEGLSCMYQCENTPGSYSCVCPPGYGSSQFGGGTCNDIDECALNHDNCSSSETCFNTRGGFKCVELDCPHNYAKTSTRRRCVRQKCRNAKNKRSCLRLPKQISFHNITVLNNSPKDKAIFRMSLAKAYPTDRYYFRLTEGNDDKAFRVSKRKIRKRQTGIVYTTRRLHGPRDYVVDLTLKLYRRRRWATFISRLYIYVSEFNF